MTGFAAFLRKELLEIPRTWRIWVLPLFVLVFALTSPVLALFIPDLVAAFAGSEPGVVIHLPEPVAVDGYQQFLKNLNQIVLIAIIVTGAGAVSGERRAGTAGLVLTKPLSRAAFLAAKIVSQSTLIVLTTAVGAGLCVAMTALCFGAAPVAAFLAAVGLWLVYALFVVAIMTLVSTLFRAQGGAVGAGLAVYFGLIVLGSWPAAADRTPAGLPVAAWGVLSGEPAAVGWPLGTAVAAAVVAAIAAVKVFRTKEL